MVYSESPYKSGAPDKQMGLSRWSNSNFEYGRKVLNSGLEGARSGREAFLDGRSLTPFLSESVRNSWMPAVVGACIGVLSSFPENRHKSMSKVLAHGLFGAALGWSVGFAWNSRRLTESIASGARKGISKVCDEHWLENHPIDYA
jgi:hypothetical protein